MMAALSKPARTPRRKVKKEACPSKPREGPTQFDQRLPRVSDASAAHESVFVKNMSTAAETVRRDTRDVQRRRRDLLRRARLEQGLPATPEHGHLDYAPPPSAPKTPTAKLGSALLGALDPEPVPVEEPAPKPKKRKPRRKPRSYSDLLHPWQRLLRDQLSLHGELPGEGPPVERPADPLLRSLLSPGLAPADIFRQQSQFGSQYDQAGQYDGSGYGGGSGFGGGGGFEVNF